MAVTITLLAVLAGLVGLLLWMRRQDATSAEPADVAGRSPSASVPEPDASSPSSRDGAPSDTDLGDLTGAADALFDAPPAEPTPRESTRAPAEVAEPRPRDGDVSNPAPVEANAKHCLVGVTGNVKDKVYAVGDKTVTVGRLPNNFIQLDDGDVSRVHCQLRGGVEQLQLMAMETANGTRLNDTLIEAHSLHTLEDGDLLEVGRTVFMYRERASATEVEADKKSRGVGTEAATAMVGGKKWSDRVRSELARHGGDIDDTARTLSIDKAVLEHMIEQLGVEQS